MDAQLQAQLRERLREGIGQLGLREKPESLDALVTYLALLQKWNEAFNLSGIRDPLQMVSQHLLDSLALSPYLQGETVLDIGSGAGLPGIPLAIFNPDKNFILLDSNSKKTRFLFQVKLALQAANLEVENSRAEHYQCQRQIDIVTSRAFGALASQVEIAGAATGNQGVLLAMKGSYPEQEIARLPKGYSVSRAVRLTVPGVTGSRYLIEIPLARD